MVLKIIYWFALLVHIAETSARKAEKDVNPSQWNFCSCDMTNGTCDVYCCCDEDCTSFHRQAFSCRNSTHVDQKHSWNCGSFESLPGHGFEQLLCVVKENSPYIGMYFEDFQGVKDLPSLHSLLKSKFNLAEKPSGKSTQDKTVVRKRSIESHGYVSGKELQVILKDSYIYIGRLSIPHSLYSQHCEISYPMQYLKDISSTCITNVQEACLTTSSSFDVRNFLIDSDKQKLLGASGDDSPLGDIKTSFHYFEHACCYLRDCGSYVSCHKRPLSIFPQPPILSYDGTVCRNGVVEVRYAFRWHGGRILSASVDVVMQNISLTTTAYVPQHFSVEFLHQDNHTVFRNKSATSNPFIRGSYELGNSLVGLVNETVFWDDDYVDENTTFASTPLLMWTSDLEGGCSFDDATIKFGINKLSGCYLKVSASSNCSDLRSEVLSLQNRIFDADGVSNGRDPELSAFVEIQQLVASEDDLQNSSSSCRFCANIPNHVHLEVTYAKFAEIDNKPLYLIIGARRSYVTSAWTRTTPVKEESYPLFSTVEFKYVSAEEERLLKTVKRFWLPNEPIANCKEETCWRELLYPLTNILFGSDYHHRLSVVKNALFLIFVLIVSSLFLLKIRKRSGTLTFNTLAS